MVVVRSIGSHWQDPGRDGREEHQPNHHHKKKKQWDQEDPHIDNDNGVTSGVGVDLEYSFNLSLSLSIDRSKDGSFGSTVP